MHGQSDLLGEMIGNLIDNAIRYAGDRAVITVRVSRDGEHARLDVIDNGPGIPADERDAVFERFHRGSKTQTVEGTSRIVDRARDRACASGQRYAGRCGWRWVGRDDLAAANDAAPRAA